MIYIFALVFNAGVFTYNKDMASLDLKGRWIIVTGASSGLGRALALRLAEREGANLWVCARREDRLKSLREEIRARTRVEVQILRADLSLEEERKKLLERVEEEAPAFGLINNAGMTHYGVTKLSDMGKYLRVLELNLISVMDLSLRFLTQARKREEGFLLNVTSEAAFVPTPYQVAYAMSKHGIQAFTDAMRAESSGKNFFIGTFVPGGIRTDMITRSGLDKRIHRDSWVNMSPERAARCCVAGLKRRRPINIPGLMNKINHLVTKLLPRAWTLVAAERLYRPPGMESDQE